MTTDSGAISDVAETSTPMSRAWRDPRFSPANLFRSYGGLIAIALLAYALLVWAPGELTPFRLGNLGKYCCWAIAAVGIGLAWGRGGMLVMGQGVFFGLGGYIMAMHMKLEATGPGEVPDFMSLYGDGTMPFWWEPFRNGAFTMVAIIVLSGSSAGKTVANAWIRSRIDMGSLRKMGRSRTLAPAATTWSSGRRSRPPAEAGPPDRARGPACRPGR